MNVAVVCDTGALISLEKLDNGFSFIRKLYDKLIVPKAVFSEYLVGGDLTALVKSGFIEVVDSPVIHHFPGIERLHQGEIEAISVALELQKQFQAEKGGESVLLLIEERMGREIAQSLGLKISGIAGQIIKARRLGLIDSDTAISHTQNMLKYGRVHRRLHSRMLETINTFPDYR